MDVGYSLIGGSPAALDKIFETKRRGASKRNAMLGNDEIQRQVQILDARGRAVLDAITCEHDLPLGAVAPVHPDHALIAALDDEARDGSLKDGTVCMLVNAGPFHDAICALSLAAGHPLFGSSANLSLTGTKFRVEDIEPEIKAIADIVIDHGLAKYHLYRASSTLLDLDTMEVVRHGACFEIIADILKRQFDITLPPPP